MITDYASLQLEAAKAAQRRDLASLMPSMVQRAEAGLFRDASIRQLQMTVSGSTSDNAIALPADVGEIVSIVLDKDGRSFAVDYLNTFEGLPTTSGSVPHWYAVEPGFARLYPTTTAAYGYTLRYVPKFTPLSDVLPNNWLLLNAPDVYLYATCVQIGIHTQDDALITRHQQFLNTAVSSLLSQDRRARFPQQGGLQIRPRSAR